MEIRTLSDLVFHLREISAGRPELLTARLPGGRRETSSTADFLRNVHSLALALDARGAGGGERVALYSENRTEWPTVDFACQLLGAPTVPLHPALPAEQVGYVLRNSGARWIFYSDAAKRDLLAGLSGSLTSPLQPVAFESDALLPEGISLTRLLGEGAERRGDVPLERFRGRVGADELATILYTSGATGEPKGVMLTHRNLVSNVLACAERFELGPRDVALSVLPLAHVFQRTVDALCFFRGTAICYQAAESDAAEAFAEVRPTVVAGAPRLYGELRRRILLEVERDGALRRTLVAWALRTGHRHAAARRHGFVGPWLALRRALADLLVLRSIRRRLGGRLRLAICGGASLAEPVERFFQAVGLPLYQGYGLTEASPVLTANVPEEERPGSVGRPLPGVELRIDDDGEVLARSPGVMQSYWADPAATREVLDPDGWLRTGDLGHVDDSGYVYVTGRKKDLLVTSGGENVAPRPIEARLAGRGPIAQALVVGEGRPYLGALLVPDLEALGLETGEPSPAEVLRHPLTERRIAAAVEEVNSGLSEAERIRAWRLLQRPFTVETGELTPTYELRREAIARRYAEEIASLYDDEPADGAAAPAPPRRDR